MHPRFTIPYFALLAATLLLAPAGCERHDGADTSIEEVRDSPNAYMGKVITAVGEVERTYPSGAFTLDGEGTWWRDDILVVVPREQMMPLERGADVRVTGEVMQLEVVEVEREYGLDFEEEVETQWRNAPVLVARNLTVLEPG